MGVRVVQDESFKPSLSLPRDNSPLAALPAFRCCRLCLFCTQQRDRSSRRGIRPVPSSFTCTELKPSRWEAALTAHLLYLTSHTPAWAPSQGCWPSCCYLENKLVHLHLPFSLPGIFSPSDPPWPTLPSPQISASRVILVEWTTMDETPPRPSPIASMVLLIPSACRSLADLCLPHQKTSCVGRSHGDPAPPVPPAGLTLSTQEKLIR